MEEQGTRSGVVVDGVERTSSLRPAQPRAGRCCGISGWSSEVGWTSVTRSRLGMDISEMLFYDYGPALVLSKLQEGGTQDETKRFWE